eukprot:6077869-Amphidinium_carterae.1
MATPELVRRASKVTESLGDADMKKIEKLVECMKWLMKRKIMEWLDAHPGAVALYQYSCDCTPLRMHEYYTAQSAGNRARGSSATTHEYFVQQVFVTVALPASCMTEGPIYRDPVHVYNTERL